jgi:hypothetical protein
VIGVQLYACALCVGGCRRALQCCVGLSVASPLLLLMFAWEAYG